GTGITNATNGTFDPSTATIGNNTITYEVTVGGCTASSELLIWIDSTPDIEFVSNDAYCLFDEAANLEVTFGGGTWTGAGVSGLGIFTPENAGIGTHNLQYAVSSGACTSNIDIAITVNPHPQIIVTELNNPSCFGYTDGSISVANSGLESTVYTWPGVGFGNSISGLSAGSYLVIATNEYGCESIESIELTEPDELIANIISMNNVSCNGESDANISTSVIGGAPPYTYNWNYNGAATPNLYDLPVGVYLLTVTDSNSCVNHLNVDIVQPSPLHFSTQVNQISCFGYNDGGAILNAIGGVSPYSFETISNNYNSNESTLENLIPGEYFTTLRDNNNCTLDTSIIISQPEPINVTPIISNPSCIGNNDGSIEFMIVGGEFPYICIVDSVIYENMFIPDLSQGSYNILIEDNNACVYRIDQILLTDNQEDCIRIPNAFTPNSDGINDLWVIENLDLFKDAVTQVYNRWGQLVFETSDPTVSWDGRFNDNDLPTGSYIYVIDPKFDGKTYNGIVTIIR
ncbi:MAG: gliding motility-associated C-terminal domain-containing protein, partial [Bacteroidales bacterium]|nr:gliding motility-associated C-terminal domain-containing protein [Bacteroidales bacterium]